MSTRDALRDLRALDVVEVVPAGCFGVLVTGEAWAPHLRPGELAIVTGRQLLFNGVVIRQSPRFYGCAETCLQYTIIA